MFRLQIVSWLIVGCLGLSLLMMSPQPKSAVAQDGEIPAGTVMVDRTGAEMVYVPAATYLVGIEPDRLMEVCEERGASNIEECVYIIEEYTGATLTYSVEIPAFWIDRYEVTVEQFSQRCTTDPLAFPNGCLDYSQSRFSEDLLQEPDQPQVGVRYVDAITFCGARDARLPTEAEWEYAASGPDKLVYPWGNEFNRDYVNPLGESLPQERTYPVGSAPENQSWVGAYDMAGNAAEWVEDLFLTRFLMFLSIDEIHTSHRGFNADVRRVTRGGSWDGLPWPMTTFYRDSAPIYEVNHWVGFRCVRTARP